MRLFLTAPNFLLLDEPTTHLDLDGRRLLQDALKKYAGTILIVSHDIEFVREVATSVLEITREGVRSFPGGYDYYCEKKSQMAVQSGGARSVSANDGSRSPDASSAPTAKELRQQRAAERAKNAPRMKELKRKVETAERKIDELQQSLDVASEELFNPRPTTNFEELNRTVRTLQFEIDRYTAEWEEAATELESLS